MMACIGPPLEDQQSQQFFAFLHMGQSRPLFSLFSSFLSFQQKL